jgi:hypothetical protein
VISIRSNAGTLAGQIRAFAQRLPRVTQKRMDLWSRSTSNVLRGRAATVVKSGISGRCVRMGGQFVALIRSRHLVGLWQETGTGLHGPLKKLITAKGGAYVNPVTGKTVKRRMLRIPTSGATYYATTKATAIRGGGGVSYVTTYKAGRGFIFRPWSRGMKKRPWFYVTIRAQVPALQSGLLHDYQQAIREFSNPLPGR